MRLILLGFLLHWKDKLAVGGVQVYSQMVKKEVSAIQPLGVVLGLQENCELLQEVETTMVSSS